MNPLDLSNADRIALELGHAGRNAIPYVDEDRNSDRPFTLHTYRPYGYTPDRPVVLVQHGALRNGADYRDYWIEAADRHKLLVVAPTFPEAVWPGVESYDNGRVFSPGGNPRHVDGWAYALPARVLADIRAAEVSECAQVYLFGHGAGAQFVQRLLGSQPTAPYHAAAACNAGWYSLPTLDLPFPEGLGGVGLTDAHIERLLAYPLRILAGEQDIATDGPDLPADPAALRQGAHRHARAHHYLQAGRDEAARRGVPCNWTLHSVPGIGHDGRAMSAVCASLWFDGGMPDADALARLAAA